MAKNQVSAAIGSLKALLSTALVSGDDDFVRDAVRGSLQEVLEEAMTTALGAGKGERSVGRLGYRSGHYDRGLVGRVGRIALRVPQDRDGRFSPEHATTAGGTPNDGDWVLWSARRAGAQPDRAGGPTAVDGPS